MKKERAAAFAAVCIIAAALTGCKVDVNSLAGSSSKQGTVSSDTDSAVRSEVFYTNDTDSDKPAGSDTKTETDTVSSQSDTDPSAFDESKYLTMFVSGAAKIPLSADALYGSEQVGELKCGDRVSVVRRDVMGYCFVYSSELSAFGYIGTDYLADYLEETTVGDVYFVRPAEASVYADIGFTETLETVKMNDMLTVIVKRTDGKWRVADKNGKIGYIDKSLLSEKKVKNESKKTSSRTEEPKTSSRSESSRTAGSAVSSEEEVSGLYTGSGEAPEEYETYIVDVDVGYLSLRAKPSKSSKSIGELYLDERVYVIDASGDYWYIYSPKLKKYGYVTGDLNYLYPEYYDD